MAAEGLEPRFMKEEEEEEEEESSEEEEELTPEEQGKLLVMALICTDKCHPLFELEINIILKVITLFY